jgi:hypothetical protein
LFSTSSTRPTWTDSICGKSLWKRGARHFDLRSKETDRLRFSQQIEGDPSTILKSACGPRSSEGKTRVSRNARKGGTRQVLRALARSLAALRARGARRG